MVLKNFVKQEGFKDCGPCCLLMIIKHYKGYYSLEELKDMCKTNKSGTDAYHLIEAAKKCGFSSNAIKCDLSDLENIVLPCIAFVTINKKYNHYVVIDKVDFKKKKIHVKDPTGTIKWYNFNHFQDIFNNVIIYFIPIKKIPFNHKNSFINFVFNIINTSTKEFIETIIISIFITLFSIISSFYLQFMIDNVTSKSKIILIFILFLIIYLFKIISDFLRNKLIILINNKVSLELNENIFKQIVKLPYHYYRNNTTGEIISKINDLDIIKQVISNVAISVIDLPLTIISLVIMYIINKTLFFIGLIIMLLYFLCMFLFRKVFDNYIDSCTQKQAECTSFMVEAINGFESVKGCLLEEKVINDYECKYSKFLNETYTFDNVYNIQYLFKEIIGNIGFIIIIFVGIMLVIKGEMTIGMLLSFNSLLIYFLEPIKNIINLDSSIRHSFISIKKILKILYSKKENYVVDRSLEGDIEYRNLSYSYDDVNNVLNNINLKIKKGNKVIVLGKSGSGKSTLFKFLKKYYDIERNKVIVNGIDINDYRQSDVVYISQDEILFTDTLLNNIGSSDLNIARICLLDDIISKNNLGFNMLIEENGFNLSGGEKERIILARALNRNFNILVIDEGLSQVDVKMEREILKNLISFYKDKTIIFISHREDNKDLFNQIIRLQDGVLID